MSTSDKKGKCFPDKIWEYRSASEISASDLAKQLHINNLLARVLISRGLEAPSEIKSFLHPRLSSIKDPNQLQDMKIAANRLKKAIQNNEKICIYGDYDVDGITATVIILRFLYWLGKKGDYYIPNRISEGYGLNFPAIERIAENGAKLLITVDNGISSLKEVEFANSLGMDVIVTDHHQSDTDLPKAIAVVNPNRKDALHSHTPLAGVGVAFKLIHATSRILDVDPESAKRFLTSLLDLVALGTVADIVPLIGENRILVKHGLKKLEETEKVGLKTLLQLTWSQNKPITPDSISYYIAPRINAAGRADQASLCIDLLTTEDNIKAIEISRRLNRLNDERRKLEMDILESCLSYIDQKLAVDEEKVLVIPGEGWHIGVVGIVASRLLERYHKPSIVLAVDQNTARGSGRSIKGFDLFQALVECNEYLKEYGGHKRAVGLTLETANIPHFQKAINEYAGNVIDAFMDIPKILIDFEVNAEDLTMENITALSALEPLGTANPSPVFFMRGVSLLELPRVVGKDHIKLLLCQDGISFSAIGFSMAECFPELDNLSLNWQIAFTPYINEWRGYKNVELAIKDIKPENNG